ncbi:MAG TPA: response regulator transcription factor [Chitinophagaceae bacterium]|nr:response regulator transcription factor [Chitinophagaceae bacterium]
MKNRIAMQEAFRIMLVEDDQTIRESYAYLIEQYADFNIVGAFSNAEDAIKNVQSLDPHIILLDIELPGISGIQAIPELLNNCPDTYIIMLTVFEQAQNIFKALENGASGYLTKDTDPEKIVEALHDVLHGGGPMSANVARLVVSSFQKNPNSPLTKRETQILKEVANGKTRGQIANELFIDIETVKTHIKNIYQKLDVRSRADAIALAKKEKYI